MNPSSILMGFLFFVLELPGAKAPASLPGMYFPASLPRAASLTSAGDLSAHHFPTKSASPPAAGSLASSPQESLHSLLSHNIDSSTDRFYN